MRELADGHAEGDEWRCEPRRLVSDLPYFTCTSPMLLVRGLFDNLVLTSRGDSVTPMSTILAAYDVFIHDETAQVGKALEASADRLVFYDPPEYGKGHTTEQAASVCEVAFPNTCIAKDLGWEMSPRDLQ